MNEHLPTIREDVSLADYSTMRLGGPGRYLCHVTNKAELAAAVDWAQERQLPILALGGGSNIVFGPKGFDGLVIINELLDFRLVAEDEASATYYIGAGENWDSVVARTVEQGLSGIEALSLIPGSAGGTPVQNVGAYGQEISETLLDVEVYDMTQHTFEILPASSLELAYRSSNLKVPTDQRRYIVVGMQLRLSKTMTLHRPLYEALESYFTEQHVTELTPQTVRDAVVAIRKRKLPDPAVTPNMGSFFANPIVDAAEHARLQADFPELKAWPLPDGRYKLAAAWLIEQAGLKGYRAHGLATHDKQALIVLNESAKDAHDLMQFRDEIVAAVQHKFGVTLKPEPELIGE